jgi:hypothetical protein
VEIEGGPTLLLGSGEKGVELITELKSAAGQATEVTPRGEVSRAFKQVLAETEPNDASATAAEG